MTPKEALNKAWDLVHEKYPSNDEEIQLVRYAIKRAIDSEQVLTELEELKRYPTADEVCEALSKYWGNQVQYDERHCLFEMYVGDNTWKPIELLRMRTNKPSLITLIGRFYEGIEKK